MSITLVAATLVVAGLATLYLFIGWWVAAWVAVINIFLGYLVRFFLGLPISGETSRKMMVLIVIGWLPMIIWAMGQAVAEAFPLDLPEPHVACSGE